MDQSSLPPWLEDATKAAQYMVTKWIKSVLHEASIQALKVRLQTKQIHNIDDVDSSDNAEDAMGTHDGEGGDSVNITSVGNIPKIILTKDDLDMCTRTCKRLGYIWMKKLHAKGQNNVAKWVERVLEKEQFWAEDDDDENNDEIKQQEKREEVIDTNNVNNSNDKEKARNQRQRDGEDDTTNELKDKTSTCPLETSNRHSPPCVEEAKEEEECIEDNSDGSNHKKGRVTQESSGNRRSNRINETETPALILTKLHRLGSEDIGNYKRKSERYYIDLLDEMGRRGETLWPYNWSIIEAAAKQNIKRLHTETIKGRPKPIQKRKWRPDFVRRKKEDDNKKQQLQSSKIATDNVTEMTSNDDTTQPQLKKIRSLDSIGRKPSSIGPQEKWLWNEEVVASFSEYDLDILQKEMLVDYHCSTDDKDGGGETKSNSNENDDKAEYSSVTGALKTLGQFHLYSKQENDENLVKAIKHGTEKERKKLLRKARKERFGLHIPEKDHHYNAQQQKSNQKYISKVIRATSSSNSNVNATASGYTIDNVSYRGNQQQQNWLEFDLGECLMEVSPTTTTTTATCSLVGKQEKIVCAFSSLEVSLLE